MHKFVRDLVTEWRRLGMPFEEKTVIAAVSGGADSVSLLLALDDLIRRKKLSIRLIAAHFNHKLRSDESEGDEKFVRSLCTRLKIELVLGRDHISAEGNLEQNARDARYLFLAKTAEDLGAFAVVTGHTVNDQAETFLLNLIRGSGPDGLCGMRPVRQLGGTSSMLVRPLLKWAKRRGTEGFCREMNVEYRYDTMNEETAFKRVRIRKILLPLLEDINPNIVETLANTAELMQHMGQPKPEVDAAPLALTELREMPQNLLYEFLRAWLGKNRGTTRSLQLKHIQAIERLVLSEKSGKTAELPGGARVVKTGGKLRYEENKVDN